MESIQQSNNEDYENQEIYVKKASARTHAKNKTMVSIDEPGTILPVIKSNLSSTKNNKKK